jgi:galactokinase
VELAPNLGREVHAFSAEAGEPVRTYLLGAEAPAGAWIDRVQGVTEILRQEGTPVSGFDLNVASQIPSGAGLSGGAAMVVAILRALREVFSLSLDDLRLAKAGHGAESRFMGAPTGIVDLLASSLGDSRSALFVDVRTLAHERLALPREVEPLVIASGTDRARAMDELRSRRKECDLAAQMLGVARLGDLGERDLSRAAKLPEPLGRRVRHVVREDARVRDAVDALRRRDGDYLGALLDASHASQRDDFEISRPEIDALVALSRAQPEVLGARLSGWGLGGSIVALARAGTGLTVGLRIVDRFARLSGLGASLLIPSGPAAPRP